MEIRQRQLGFMLCEPDQPYFFANQNNTDFAHKHFSFYHYFCSDMGCNKVDKNQKFNTLDIIESWSEEIRLL